jgi:Fe-S cluster assembly protein SufD
MTVAHYQTEFERESKRLGDAAHLDAWQRFAQQGFPTIKHEDWKYTSVAALEKLALSCAAAPDAALTWDTLKAHAVLPETPHRLVFVDGAFKPELSCMAELPKGFHVAPWSSQSETERARLHAILKPAQQCTPFAALNGAFMTDGAVIRAEAGVVVDEPVLILVVSTAAQHAAHLAHVMEGGVNSNFAVVEHYIGLVDAPYLNTVVSRIIAHENAHVTHIKIQQEAEHGYHVATVQAVQHKNSHLHSSAFALSGALGRNDIETQLNEPGAEVVMNGVYYIKERGHQDFHTSIRHNSPDCSSSECYKGILMGGRAVFNGKIVVAVDAQHTRSEQSNHNLLLSDKAEVDTKPQLEIFADDVKCSHGTTVGQLDDEQWFYLRSRGIAATEARALLIEAFALDISARIEQPLLREALDQLLKGVIRV